MPTTRLHLARHGEVDASWSERLYGDLDVPLSERGRAQSQRIASRWSSLPLERVWSSGLARTQHIAALWSERSGRASELEPALREISRGAWAGRTRAELEREQPGELAAWFAAPAQRRPAQGESLGDVAARATAAVERIARACAGAEIGIATHLWVLRALVCGCVGLELERAGQLELPYGAMLCIDWPAERERRPVLVAYNCDLLPQRDREWRRGPHRA